LDTDKLLDALNLDADSVNTDDVDLGTDTTATAKAPPASPTALKLDEWSVRRGEDAMSKGDVLPPILHPLISSEEEETLIAADMMGAAFELEPELAESCEDPIRHRFMEQLMQTEEYQSLHESTQLDVVASELAAGHFAQGYVELVQEVEEEKEEEEPQDGDGNDDGKKDLKKKIQAAGKAAKALGEATKDVDDLSDAQQALGIGTEDGNGDSVNAAELRKQFDLIRKNPMLRAVIDNAGRYRRYARALQRTKTMHGSDEVTGIEMGNDFSKVLPSELAMMTDNDFELIKFREFLEASLLQFEEKGTKKKAKGPIVVSIDESGSMHGNKIEQAKGFALAMGWIARTQKRWILLHGWANYGQSRILALPPSGWNQIDLIDWLSQFFSGGTDIGIPLEQLPKQWKQLGCPAGKTDMILLTDDEVNLTPEIVESFNAWKEDNEVRLYSMILTGGYGYYGSSDYEPSLAQVSDKWWKLENLNIENDAIRDALSV